MKSWMPIFALSCWTIAAGTSFGDERSTLTGKVLDANGKPVEHATVFVHEARVKKGYSIYCPTCWVDCGKHAATDETGSYIIPRLSSDLLFTLLVVRDGYAPTYVEKVDPSLGPAETAVLKSRPTVENVSQLVRGRVVDGHGDPVRDAVVEQQGVTYRGEGGGLRTQFGGRDEYDSIAVTNEKGEFEIAYGKPAVRMILQVRARAMAPKLFTEPTGADRKTMTVTDGTTIRGRLVRDGKPITNAEVGLTTSRRRAGTVYSEFLVGTREDGTFAITNVPAGRIWYVYPKMESVADRNIGADLIACETKGDGQVVDVGDIELLPAHTLRGKVVLSDGKPVPPDMHVTLSIDRAWDTQFAVIGPDGSFQFRGLPKGVYELLPGVKGYRFGDGFGTDVLVDRDVHDVTLTMEPVTGRP